MVEKDLFSLIYMSNSAIIPQWLNLARLSTSYLVPYKLFSAFLWQR